MRKIKCAKSRQAITKIKTTLDASSSLDTVDVIDN